MDQESIVTLVTTLMSALLNPVQEQIANSYKHIGDRLQRIDETLRTQSSLGPRLEVAEKAIAELQQTAKDDAKEKGTDLATLAKIGAVIGGVIAAIVGGVKFIGPG